MTMIRVVAAMASAVALGSCSGSSFGPSIDMTPKWENMEFKPSTISLKVQSNPPGAEARAPQGLTCRTPCTLELPVMNEPFDVSYTLTGYLPQIVSIRPIMPAQSLRGLPFYMPDPAVAQLSPEPPPPPPPPSKPKKPAVATARPAAPIAQASSAGQAPPTMDAPQPYPYPPPPSVFGLKRY